MAWTQNQLQVTIRQKESWFSIVSGSKSTLDSFITKLVIYGSNNILVEKVTSGVKVKEMGLKMTCVKTFVFKKANLPQFDKNLPIVLRTVSLLPSLMKSRNPIDIFSRCS